MYIKARPRQLVAVHQLKRHVGCRQEIPIPTFSSVHLTVESGTRGAPDPRVVHPNPSAIRVAVMFHPILALRRRAWLLGHKTKRSLGGGAILQKTGLLLEANCIR